MPLTEMEMGRQRNRFRLGVEGGRQAVFITARRVGNSQMIQTVMLRGQLQGSGRARHLSPQHVDGP